MGRYYWNKKTTTEECNSIRVQFLREHGYLKNNSLKNGGISWSRNGEVVGSVGFYVSTKDNYIRFSYTYRLQSEDSKPVDKEYSVDLTTTPCNLGGVRYWFICNFCGRRVGILYLEGQKDFSCRHCLNLSYKSQNKTKGFKWLNILRHLDSLGCSDVFKKKCQDLCMRLEEHLK